MSLGNNRDYKTADRRARKGLAKHHELMQKLLVEQPTLTREEASRIAYEQMTGRKSISK